MPAQQAITPLLVPTAWLQQAIAISASGMQAAIITGPALGGVLYAASPALVYAICGALSLMAALQTLRVQIDQKPSAQAADWGTVLAGVKFVWQRKVLLGGMALDLFAVLLGGATALLPMFARDILEVGPQGLGLLRAAPAVGAVVMSLVVARFPLRRHVGKRLLLAVAIFGLATVVFGWSEHFWLSFAALAITGAAVNTLFIGASNQLGEFESGATAAWWGPVGSVVVGGLGTTLVALLWLKLFPDLAKRDRMEQPR